MRKHVLALCCACMPMAAFAQTAPQDTILMPTQVELWNGVKSGMSKSEFKSLGLPEKFELVDDCRVSLRPRFEKDLLTSVSISARWTVSYNECAILVKRSLIAKYGDSVDVEGVPANSYDTFGAYVAETWLTDDMIIVLKYKNNSFKSITYSPRLVREEAELIDNL